MRAREPDLHQTSLSVRPSSIILPYPCWVVVQHGLVRSGRVLRCSQARSESSSADGRDCESAQVRDPFYIVACRLPFHPADDSPDRTCPIYDEVGLGLSFAIERLSGQCVYGDQATFSWFFGAASLACWFQGELGDMARPLGRKRTPDD